jgi:hypothetical protein
MKSQVALDCQRRVRQCEREERREWVIHGQRQSGSGKKIEIKVGALK